MYKEYEIVFILPFQPSFFSASDFLKVCLCINKKRDNNKHYLDIVVIKS